MLNDWNFKTFGGRGMKFRYRFLLFFSIFLIIIFTSAGAFALSLEGRVKEFTLENGMKVLMLERHQSPTLALYIRFRVGAMDENLGMTGTAHLLEHMLFKGTKTLGTRNFAEEEKILTRIDAAGMSLDTERAKGEKADPSIIKNLEETLKGLQAEHKKWIVKDEIELVYSQNGGVGFNAMTSADTTTYIVSLPSNRLELWARIESDRILNPVLREFYSERDVVMEERRQSIESQPDRKLLENFLAAAFFAHPYGRPIIGWSSDLQFLDKKKTEEFFRTYYSPANTVLTLVGDLNPDEALPLIKKYFDRIPRQILPPPLRTQEPEQIGERRIQVEADANPQLIIGFHKPNPPNLDDAAFDLIDGLLSSGRTSRLFQKLVEEKKIAAEVSTANGFPGERASNLFVIFAAPRHPHTVQELEKGIWQELERLQSEPVPKEELQKIKNQIQTSFLRKLNSNSKLAYWLSYGQTLFDDWRYITKHLESYENITPEEIQRVAQKYFSIRNRTVATLVKTLPSPQAQEK
jgi:predicted Zn-dependent peptidase